MKERVNLIRQFISYVKTPPNDMRSFMDKLVDMMVAVIELSTHHNKAYLRITYDVHKEVVTIWQYNIIIPKFITYYVNKYFKYQNVLECNAIHTEFTIDGCNIDIKAHTH